MTKSAQGSESAQICTLLGPSSLAGASSAGLGRKDVAIERRVNHPGEKPERAIDAHFLILWQGDGGEGELAPSSGRFIRYRKPPNSITTRLPGLRPATRSKVAQSVLVCSLTSRFLHDLELELESRPVGPKLAKMAPLERIGGPADIAATVSFLAGSDGGWINAQVVRANGGFA